MDDKLILKILRAVPTDKWVFPEDVPVDGVTGDMLYELHQSGLLHYEWRNLPYDKKHYRRTCAGSDWIRDYRNQNYLNRMTLAILLLAIPVAIASIPVLWEIALWVLCKAQ